MPCSTKKPSSKEPANDEMSIPVPVGPEKTAPNTPPKEEVGSEDRYTPEIANKWAEPVHMNGPQVIPWSTTQFCERIVDHFAPMAVKYQKAKEPALQFLDDCTVFLGSGSGCIPQCKSLSGLYDEASRPGGETGNIWERPSQRWDYERNIPMPDVAEDPASRVLAYAISVKDCVTCVLHDNCVPSCLYTGMCGGDDSQPLG